MEVTTGELFSSSATPTVKGEPLSCNAMSLYFSNVQVASYSCMIELSGSDKPPRKISSSRFHRTESGVPVLENLQHSPQWTLYLGGVAVASTLLLDPSLAKSSVTKGLRRVDPFAILL